MKAKKWLIGGLTAAMALTMAIGFAACDDKDDEHTTHPDANGDGICDIGGEVLNPPKDEVKLTDGIYISDGIEMGAGRGLAYNYVRFHENGVFYYAQMAQPTAPGGGLGSYAGYWELVKEDFTFFDGVEGIEKTASEYVKFTNFDGSDFGIHQSNGDAEDGVSPEYDNKVPLINDELYGIWYTNMLYKHDLTNTDYTLDKENNKEVEKFVKEAGAADAVTLYHNGKFDDYITDSENIYEGTWKASGKTYTLTEEGGKTATLVVAADGKTAEYNDFKGAKQSLVSSDTVAKTVQILMRGDFTVIRNIPGPDGQNHDVELPGYIVMNLYDNGTMDGTVNMPASGVVDVPIGSGTWVMDMTTYVITLTLNGNDYTIPTSTFEFVYTLTGMGSEDIVVTMHRLTTEAVFTGDNLVQGVMPISTTLTLQKYGTKYIASVTTDMGTMGTYSEEGEWSYDETSDTYTVKFVREIPATEEGGQPTYQEFTFTSTVADGVYTIEYTFPFGSMSAVPATVTFAKA